MGLSYYCKWEDPLEKSIHSKDILCIHATPSFVSYGSVVGNYNPWKR